MREDPQTERRALDELSDRLRGARMMTSELLSDVIAATCRRFPSIGPARSAAARVERLIKSTAWTDAVLALIEVELPQWRLRRIIYDEGEWHCALSRQRELPDWLDQAVESSHADLSLAMLGAFIDAQRSSAPAARTSVPSAPCMADAFYAPLCCDNFA
jgi:hypothetical protein